MAADKRSPSVRARQLAEELRRLRDASRLTGEQVAGQLGWSPSKVSRTETATTVPKLADLRRLLDVYEISGTQRNRLEVLCQEADERGWWDAYADILGPEYAALIALEAQAASVCWYSPMLVPGLLQTELYAREVVSSGLLIAPRGEIERRVQVKMTRQRVLTNEDPLHLNVILDEAALHRQVGGAEVMRAQAEHLAEMAARPNVTVQVLPFRAGPHPATAGEFTLLRFPELVATDVVCLENMTSTLYVESETEVYRYGLAFDRLSTLALEADESLTLIAGLMGNIK